MVCSERWIPSKLDLLVSIPSRRKRFSVSNMSRLVPRPYQPPVHWRRHTQFVLIILCQLEPIFFRRGNSYNKIMVQFCTSISLPLRSVYYELALTIRVSQPGHLCPTQTQCPLRAALFIIPYRNFCSKYSDWKRFSPCQSTVLINPSIWTYQLIRH